jgi:hypothetical protein
VKAGNISRIDAMEILNCLKYKGTRNEFAFIVKRLLIMRRR